MTICIVYIRLYTYMYMQIFRLESARLRLYIYIYTNPTVLAGFDTKSIFKQSLRGLVAEPRLKNTLCSTIYP